MELGIYNSSAAEYLPNIHIFLVWNTNTGKTRKTLGLGLRISLRRPSVCKALSSILCYLRGGWEKLFVHLVFGQPDVS